MKLVWAKTCLGENVSPFGKFPLPRSHVVILVGQHQSSLCYLWALSVAWQRLARLPTPSGLTKDLNPCVTKMEFPRLRMLLLCALAPDQNVVGLVDCGLSSTLPSCQPKTR
jgi:hypothetical protein